ncbi:luciferin 4-monooxygenase-like [Macrosteles quadrilineatus]|uniref:luciferin 4-monooxygenase-like n=1 Tax=Macrosteles quadrilineatus TaxID=74068 RepID=UPI0023E21F83|nr:luciferin 4-monooxygenase-like [Macrosteles quadrilineatus]
MSDRAKSTLCSNPYRFRQVDYDTDALNPYPAGNWMELEQIDKSALLQEHGKGVETRSSAATDDEGMSSSDKTEEIEEDTEDKRDNILRGPIWNYGIRNLNLDTDYYNNLLFGVPFKSIETPENMILKGEKWTSSKRITSSLAVFILKKLKKMGFEKTALMELETGRTLSYGELANKVESLACGLHWRGVQPGQIIAIVSFHSLEAHILVLACLLIGAVVAFIDSSQSPAELSISLRMTGPHLLFTEGGKTLSKVETAVGYLEMALHNPKPQLIINSTTMPKSANYLLFHQLFREVEPVVGPRQADPLRPIMILYTGSSDNPRACLIAERYFTHSKAFVDTVLPESDEPSITVMVTPPMYCALAIKTVLNHYVDGHRIVLCRGQIPVPCLITALRKFEVFAILTIRDTLMALLDWPAKPRCPQLKLVAVTGVPLRLKNLLRVHKELFKKQVQILQLYGLVETGTAAANTFVENKHGSVGKLFYNVEMKVLDEGSGMPCGINQEGQLCVRSPTMMLEYYNNPTANNETIDSEGFIHTGDLGFYDEQGFVHVTDRVRETIKWRTYLVSPSVIEEVLLELPQVKEALVFGLLDDEDGELVSAAVVLELGHEHTDILVLEKQANCLLPFHRKIRGGIFIFNQFPRSTIGNPMKAHLLQEVLARLNMSRKRHTA